MRAETELVEAEQAAERSRERAAGGALDDLAEQDVAGVGVVELLPGRGVGLAVRDREAHLLGPRPVMAPVRQDVLDELRIARVVVEAARVHEQMADVDRVGVVAAAAEQRDRRRCEMLGDRVVETEAAVLGEPQDRGSGERLGDARDPEAGSGIEHGARPERGVAGAPRPTDSRETTASATPG